MEDIVKAIGKLAEKDAIDYLLVIVPIVVSIVAIVISIATARKQNKIALFELRYRALLQIKTILNFEEIIDPEDSHQAIKRAFDMFYSTDICSQNDITALMTCAGQMRIIELDIESLFFLLDKKHQDIFVKLLSAFSGIIIDAINKHETAESKAEFHSACQIIKNEVYEYLLKSIKV